ncbi:MAG: HEAT repeat domain-containing protein [Candidatus Hodarchaeales archaeon]|jgi:HEAT repeat protein
MEDPKTRKVKELITNLANQDLDEDTRCQVVEILGEISGEIAVDPLLSVLNRDKSWRLRLACLKSLGKLPGAEKSLGTIEKIVNNKEERVDLRKWAIISMIKISKNTSDVIPIAIDSNENETVRTAAVESLDGNESEFAQEKLALSIKDPDEPLKVKWSVLAYLSRHGSKKLISILEPLIEEESIEEDLQIALKNVLNKIKTR